MPKNRYGMFRLTTVWEPAPGRFSGHEENDPPVETSSGIDTSRTPWPPVCEPDTPVMSRSISDAPCPAGRGNLFR